MKRLISVILVASLSAATCPAWATGPVTPAATTATPPVVSPIAKGQPAPYSGVLFSPPAVAQIVSQADAAQQALQLAVQHQLDMDGAQLTFQLAQLSTTCTTDKNDLQAQIADNQKQNTALQAQLKQSSSGPGAPVWIGLGAVGGIVVTVLLALAVSKL